MEIENKRPVEFVGDVQELLQNLQNVKNEVEKTKNDLRLRQGQVDIHINELYHLIELNHLSVRDKIKICDELHNLLTERRKIKETMDVVNGLKTLNNALEVQNFKYQFTNPVCIDISKKNIKLNRAVYIEHKNTKTEESASKSLISKEQIKIGQIYITTSETELTVKGVGKYEIQCIDSKGKCRRYNIKDFIVCIRDDVFKLKGEV